MKLAENIGEGNIKEVRKCLLNGDNPNQDYGGMTLLSLACNVGNVDVIYELLSHGADANAANLNDKINQPLLLAAFSCESKAITILLQAGAEVNQINEIGQTALMIAAKAGKVDAIQILLDNGALINKQDNLGRTAAHWACAGGDFVDVVIILKKKQAQIFLS
ncbi:ankyrin repeat domain-containing protein [Massilia sp. erpn]|uniref:ankyrin repeat domain-containing protein n=1 Tax=Massilia sp. erpn TaxID=2738142 RepID=UPI0021074DAF|nr:ankyrin repeat domain-containing protein [Massilia sp. erpn]UTY59406.1 ankyrin repeat domain-containing protein [Massilia sp. erpn]